VSAPTRPGRRGFLLAVGALALAPEVARSGAQKYEPLSDSVRVALASQIADSRPPERTFATIDERIAYLAWLGEMSERLRGRIGDYTARVEFLKTLYYEARPSGFDHHMGPGLTPVERKLCCKIAETKAYECGAWNI